MGKNWTQTTQGSTQSSQLYVFPDFTVGSWPTLLDAEQAHKVKSFIEGIALRSKFKIITGNVSRPAFEILWGSQGPTWQIEIPTALRLDVDPYLGAHLKLDGYDVVANRSGTVFRMSPEGLQISQRGGGSGKVVLLEGGSGSGGVGQGFKAASGGEAMVWSMMPEDGTVSQFIETNGAGALKFANALKIIELEAVDPGVVMGDTTVDLDTLDAGSDTLVLRIADGLKAVGNNTDDEITLSINSEPCTFISLIASGGAVAGDTTVEIYENALTLDAGDRITLTGTSITGEVRITADEPSGWATLIYLTEREGGIVSGSPVGLHDGHWDFFAGDGIELHKQTVPYLGVEIKTQDVDLAGDAGTGAYIIGGDDVLTFVGAGGTSTSVAGNVVTITGGGSGSYTWEAQDEHGNTQEIFDGTELTIFGSEFIHVELTPSATVPYFYVQLSASGVASDTTFLRGDNVWATPAGTGDPVLDVNGDTGSVAITLSTEELNIEGGNGIETTADGGETLTVAVDDTVGQMINGIPFGNYSANNLYLLEGDNVTLDTDTPAGTITINADKYAIVSSPEPDTYVALACVEMPETRFDDILTIDVDGKGSIEYALDPTYIHVCDPDTIKPISYTCTEAAIAGLDVVDGILHITFSHVTPLPREITVKVSGIRAGRSGKRFVKFTEEEARNNAAFWNGWTG